MLDAPNSRSLHTIAVPRSGGVAIAAGMLPVFLVMFAAAELQLRAIMLGWLLVFAVSLLDDFRSLPASLRILVHFVAAMVVLLVREDTGFDTPLALLLGVFWIVWGTNLFNFMDGMDGLAGSMSVVGGCALLAALLFAGQTSPVPVLLPAIAGSTAFLWFNAPPARIFMGDSGSAPLGFLFAAVAVGSVQDAILPWWLPVLIFLPFVADATFTLLRRGWQRKRVWEAHREHAYQSLVGAGWPVRRVLLAEIAFMLLCAGLALTPSAWTPGQGLALFGGAAFLSLAAYSVIMRNS